MENAKNEGKDIEHTALVLTLRDFSEDIWVGLVRPVRYDDGVKEMKK